MNSTPLPSKALEDGPEYFWERFSRHAVSLPVAPEPLGSPLMEIMTPLGPLLAFDRGLTPQHPSRLELILHGQASGWEADPQGTPPSAEPLGGGRYAISGRVEERLDGSFFVLRAGEVPFVLAAPNPPEPGALVTVRVAAPLMAFRDMPSRL